jgi:hypothetical protein
LVVPTVSGREIAVQEGANRNECKTVTLMVRGAVVLALHEASPGKNCTVDDGTMLAVHSCKWVEPEKWSR